MSNVDVIQPDHPHYPRQGILQEVSQSQAEPRIDTLATTLRCATWFDAPSSTGHVRLPKRRTGRDSVGAYGQFQPNARAVW
jgi:hypothetical protein